MNRPLTTVNYTLINKNYSIDLKKFMIFFGCLISFHQIFNLFYREAINWLSVVARRYHFTRRYSNLFLWLDFVIR